MSADIPSPVDFHDMGHARAWTEDTVRRRLWRPRIFAAFAEHLRQHFSDGIAVLELGSGPGHLAKAVLTQCPMVQRYVALDFSLPMHVLAHEHLGVLAARVASVTRDFRDEDWGDDLGRFDAVLTLQAAHEMRHSRHLPRFLEGAAARLKPGGLFLYCDHYAQSGSGKNPALFLERAAQPDALQAAGFTDVRLLMEEGGAALYAAVRP